MQRADLIAVSRGLAGVEGAAAREVAAARAAWPAIHGGLPPTSTPALTRAIALAETRAGELRAPAFMRFRGQLSGPATVLAGRLGSFEGLVGSCWQHVAAAATATANATGTAGSSVAARRFQRANVGLYIGCLYDGHYNLSTIGEVLVDGYRQLGGPAAFGRKLPLAGVRALAHAYSPGAVRLEPKPREDG